jgi:uncharacterized protein YcbX
MRRAPASIKKIFRYPVKGLSAESLGEAVLAAGQTVPGDRLYAIENGPCGFDPAAPAYFPKQRFLMLMRNERLARLDARFDDATHTLALREGGGTVQGNLRTPEGRQRIEAFFAAFCADELRGPPKVLHSPGHSFSDVARKVVSIINLASVAAIETLVGAPVDPLRFRANIYAEGWPPWHELELVGQTLALGANVRARVIKRIERCAATNVEPGTGIRDLSIPHSLLRACGHTDCGVYAEVIAGGTIAPGDRIDPLDEG